MRIQPVNNNLNHKGKLIIPENLSAKEKQALDTFLNCKKYGRISPKALIEKKSYDISLNRNKVDPDYLELWMSFKTDWTKETEGAFISSINTKNDNLQICIDYFRHGIDWVEDYKKNMYGYNNKFEKFIASVRFFFFG